MLFLPQINQLLLNNSGEPQQYDQAGLPHAPNRDKQKHRQGWALLNFDIFQLQSGIAQVQNMLGHTNIEPEKTQADTSRPSQTLDVPLHIFWLRISFYLPGSNFLNQNVFPFSQNLNIAASKANWQPTNLAFILVEREIRDLDIFTLSYFIVYLLKCYFIGDYLNILTTSGRGLMLSKAGIFHWMSAHSRYLFFIK